MRLSFPSICRDRIVSKDNATRGAARVAARLLEARRANDTATLCTPRRLWFASVQRTLVYTQQGRRDYHSSGEQTGSDACRIILRELGIERRAKRDFFLRELLAIIDSRG